MGLRRVYVTADSLVVTNMLTQSFVERFPPLRRNERAFVFAKDEGSVRRNTATAGSHGRNLVFLWRFESGVAPALRKM
jgi:hypothetical protein